MQSPGFHYAHRAEEFRPNLVRTIWDYDLGTDPISLGGGNPDLSVLPMDELAETANRFIADHGVAGLGYGAGAGTDGLRDALTEYMRHVGIEAERQEVLVTAGSQNAIQLLTLMLCNPGDVILCEAPTYVGAVGTFLGMEADVRHVAVDDDGLNPEALREAIRAVRAEGKRIAFLYTIPSFSNPTGIRVSTPRREELLQICRELEVQVVEDDAYGMLAFDGSKVPAMRSIDPGVIYCGSLSKVFSPGLRIGWLVATPELRHRLQIAGEATTICASTLSQHLAEQYLTEMDYLGTIARAAAIYERRAKLMLEGLPKHFPTGVTWTVPKGGFFTFLTFDNPAIDSEELVRRGIEHGVIAIPGTAFYGDGQGQQQLRLAFPVAKEDRMDEGLTRLAEVVASFG